MFALGLAVKLGQVNRNVTLPNPVRIWNSWSCYWNGVKRIFWNYANFLCWLFLPLLLYVDINIWLVTFGFHLHNAIPGFPIPKFDLTQPSLEMRKSQLWDDLPVRISSCLLLRLPFSSILPLLPFIILRPQCLSSVSRFLSFLFSPFP